MTIICTKCNSTIEQHRHVFRAEHTTHYEWHCPQCGILIGTLLHNTEAEAMTEAEYEAWLDLKETQFREELLRRGKIRVR